QREVALQEADALDLAGRQRRVLAVAVVAVVVAALELLERRERADRVAVGLAAEDLDRLLEAELRRRRDGDREPEIEVVVALVILRDAGVRVDGLGGIVDALG